MTTLYYLDRFTDEMMPCEPHLDAWAKFLSGDEVLDWNAEPAKDGERFACTVAERVDAVARWIVDDDDDHGHWEVDPPAQYDWCALTYGPGDGWDAEDVGENVRDVVEFADKGEPHPVALMRNLPSVTLEFRGGKLVEVPAGPAETDGSPQ